MAALSVEAVVVDHYMAPPLPHGALHGLPASPCYLRAHQVPVLRVFGATPAGQKTCMHIHGLFPYFYFRAENDPAFDDPEELRRLLPRIATEIERANQVKQQERSREGAGKATQGQTKDRRQPNAKLIAKLLVVQGTPFYGYHPSTKLFVQIFLYNPRSIASVVQLLESGCIAERVFQPYEAHVPFLLQVFADYNIEGMNPIHVSKCKFRAPLPTSQDHLAAALEPIDDLPVLLRPNVPSGSVNGDASALACIVKGRSVRVPEISTRWFDRQSTCVLEVDVAAECILNPTIFRSLQTSLADTGGLRSVPSLAALWEEERQRRIQNGERGTPELSLSVDRPAEQPSTNTPKDPQTAASSLLSQSFFRQKMHDAASKIIESMASQIKGPEQPSRFSESTQREGCEDVPGTLSPSNKSSSSAITSVHNNSITTESEFSFSQVEHDAMSFAETKDTTEPGNMQCEDSAIVDMLLAMHDGAGTKWIEAVRSQIDPSDKNPYEDENASMTSSEGWDGDAGFTDDSGIVEIGDILASQRLCDTVEDNYRGDQNKWWTIDDEQDTVPKRTSISELGSPRVELHQDLNEVQMDETRCDEQSEVRNNVSVGLNGAVEDIEDLLPPPPPPRPRSRRIRVSTLNNSFDKEEESITFDPQVLSLTPRPSTRRTHRINSPSTTLVTHRSNHRVFIFNPRPPTLSDLEASSRSVGIEPTDYRAAFYSSTDDIPEKAFVFSGKKFDFTPLDLAHTLPFDTREVRKLLTSDLKTQDERDTIHELMAETCPTTNQRNIRCVRTPVRPPPCRYSVSQWLERERHSGETKATPTKSHRKRCREPAAMTTSVEAKRLTPSTINSNVTMLSIEIHTDSRGVLLPDPRLDMVRVICYAVAAQEGPTEHKTKACGLIECPSEDGRSVENEGRISFYIGRGENVEVEVAKDEPELFAKLEQLVRRWDPDFLTGFEVQKESIGYLVDRAAQLNINLIQVLSRLPTTVVDARNTAAMQEPEGDGEEESGGNNTSIGSTWGVTKASGIWIHGRYILNLWRLARSEVKLSRYGREDVIRAVIGREFPVYSTEQLAAWYEGGRLLRWKVIRYTFDKAKTNLKLIDRMQLVTRTSEMARLFGMDFYSVLSRGSQFRVEAVMLRVTKRQNYLLVSPSRTQVARQAPMECIPLVMEPHSNYYPDPVVVLDFQSLYPSLVIAYNLCYSTIYGRLKGGLQAELESTLGVVDFQPSAEGLVRDKESFILAPNGVLLSSKAHRLGILPVILDEILSTRIMVKNSMKIAKQRNQHRLEKVLNARQLALKMLANVTYGYTAAGFSGRMPCAQLADAIVQCGRCTLEAAVRLVEGHADWNAKVIYGDTDSLFVLLRGRSKSDAFRIGQEIADLVTASNPRPVTLRMEKVYMGCILVSKKRYVGLKFESPYEANGVIESKGVEIVRRDSCGVVQVSMQRALQLLFNTSDLSLVKQAIEAYWVDMLDDQVPLKDYVFAKEVRLGTYARGSAPPAALVSAKAMAKDPRTEPRYAERVPYLVVNGSPGARLMDLVVSPNEFLDQRRGTMHSINYQYYIHKQIIPSLERLFLLMGANIRAWYTQMPRVTGKARTAPPVALGRSLRRSDSRAIDSFYMSKHCRLCGALGRDVLCEDCKRNPLRSEFVRQCVAVRHERELEMLRLVCTTCGGREAAEACRNVTCIVWNRVRLTRLNGERDQHATAP